MDTAMDESFSRRCAAACCRSCGRKGLLGVLDLGHMPLADGLLSKEQLAKPQRRYPLEMAFCPGCSLVQITETVAPETLFCDNYPYYSSFSPALLEHSRRNAMELIRMRRLDAGSLVVELASNDGYLLKNFVERGVPVLGIDPAEGPAAAAEKIGVPTMCVFFTRQLARKLRGDGKAADVIIANNVLAHVADTNGFVAGIAELLKDDGIAVIEAPYVKDLVDHCEFDTIYHEHLCYFSLTALTALFGRHGLHINDVRRLPIHGGSLRLYIGRQARPQQSVIDMLAQEHEAGLDGHGYYRDFSQRVMKLRSELDAMLRRIRGSGKRIAAYGAAAKGAVMLNYLGAGSELIEFVVDRNVHKHGKFMPGVHLPIFDTQRLMQDKPDYCLLLTWNFKDEILRQQEPYRQAGGKFIIPIPEAHIA